MTRPGAYKQRIRVMKIHGWKHLSQFFQYAVLSLYELSTYWNTDYMIIIN